MNVQDNQTGYNKWSSFYDEYSNPTVAIDELSFPQVYSHEKKKRVLEIGCGTGRHTLRLLENENHVTAIDISQGMLEKAKKKTSDYSETHFLLGDFLSTEFERAEFDFIVMSLVLEHIANLTFFFKKTRSLVKEGGHFYFSEIHPKRGVLAHFKSPNGEEVHLSSSHHTEEEIFSSATTNGFTVQEVRSVFGGPELVKQKSKWVKYENIPMIQIWNLRSQKIKSLS